MSTSWLRTILLYALEMAAHNPVIKVRNSSAHLLLTVNEAAPENSPRALTAPNGIRLRVAGGAGRQIARDPGKSGTTHRIPKRIQTDRYLSRRFRSFADRIRTSVQRLHAHRSSDCRT
jgi:hypothetical protein